MRLLTTFKFNIVLVCISLILCSMEVLFGTFEIEKFQLGYEIEPKQLFWSFVSF